MDNGCSVNIGVCGVLLCLYFTTAVVHCRGGSASSSGMLQYNMAALLALRSSPAVAQPTNLYLPPLLLNLPH